MSAPHTGAVKLIPQGLHFSLSFHEILLNLMKCVGWNKKPWERWAEVRQEGEAAADSLWAWQTIDGCWAFLKGLSIPSKEFESTGLGSGHSGDRKTGGGW